MRPPLLLAFLSLSPCVPLPLPSPWSPPRHRLVVLGDLHLEDDPAPFLSARDDVLRALSSLHASSATRPRGDKPADDLTLAEIEELLAERRTGGRPWTMSSSMVSLGDLGRKDIRGTQGDPGTTECFRRARDFLDGFHVPYGVVAGNHDLEGLGEFETDEGNLGAFSGAFREAFNRGEPHWARVVADKTLAVGLSTTRFREAPHSSHEVHVPPGAIDWLEAVLSAHPASEGWSVLVFTHAPILGCGLRVLRGVHLMNACAFVNHSDPPTARRFIRLVEDHPQIKMWLSGHYHLSHDHPDSISKVGACVFVQCGVMGPGSARGGRRQTRVVDVDGDGGVIRVYTVEHHKGGDVRLDATLDVTRDVLEVNEDENWGDGDLVRTYKPMEDDGCYSKSDGGFAFDPDDEVCWWHMEGGNVLGCHDGMVIEYDEGTGSPLGVVVKDLEDKEVVVGDGGRVLMLMKKGATPEEKLDTLEVVQPNRDGSYWRRWQANKKERLEQKERVEFARKWIEENA